MIPKDISFFITSADVFLRASANSLTVMGAAIFIDVTTGFGGAGFSSFSLLSSFLSSCFSLNHRSKNHPSQNHRIILRKLLFWN